MTILIDTREPWPHPWAAHFPEDVVLVRQGLETGDIAAEANPTVVIERKTVSDFLGSITAGRERFNKEMMRARYLDHFCVIVEGTMLDCMESRGGMTANSLLGTVAAITRRIGQIHFVGTERYAALLAYRILSQPIHEANQLAAAAKKSPKKLPPAAPRNPDGTLEY